MRLILDRNWLFDISQALTAIDYRSTYPRLDNYDVIEAIVKGIINDAAFNIVDIDRKFQFRAHIRAAVHELFYGHGGMSHFDNARFPAHELAEAISELRIVENLYDYVLHVTRGAPIRRLNKVEFTNDLMVIDFQLETKNHIHPRMLPVRLYG